MNACSSPSTSARTPLEYDGANLVFVVGCPRSGTTWVQRLLASHAGVRTGQESDIFDIYIGPQLQAWRRELDVSSSGRGGVGLGCYFEDTEFLRILKRYTLDLLQPMIGALEPGEIFVEKTPSHVLYVSEIAALLPAARFIHVLRDARDTVASLLSASRSWGHTWAPRTARSATGMWVQHVQAARRAQFELGPTRFYEVRYEALHADAPRELRRMMDWLGLEWSEPELLEAVAANQPEAARRGGGTKIPLGGAFGAVSGPVVKEPPGFVRKAQAGTWREDLNIAQRLWVWKVGRATMARVGYPWPVPW
ncbi:MAG: sulfotransferase [Chloroflexi bacterium]|nr:sulfotransferase [Chloroflexota bacterium]